MNLVNFRNLLALIVFVCLANTLVAQDLDLIHEKSFDVNKGETLFVETDMGDVIINRGSGSEVEIKVYGNDKAKRKIDFEFEKISKGVRIVGDRRGSSWTNIFNNMKLKIKVTVPTNFEIDTKTSGGDVLVNDIDGDKQLKTSGGDIIIKNCEGKITAKTSGGDVRVKSNKGETNTHTSGGDINISDVDGKVVAKTSGGDIKIKSVNGYLFAKTSGGDVVVDYDGENSGVELASSGGDITLYVPSDIKADAYLYTSGGDVDCDVEASRVRTSKSHKFEGQLNGGGKEITCKTSGGDIEVRTR